jgi:hypothetical protein
LLAGSLVGAWLGATWATRMRSVTLYRVLAALPVLIAAALAWTHFGSTSELGLPGGWRFPRAFAAGPGQRVALVLPGLPAGCLGHWHLHELRHSGASLMLARARISTWSRRFSDTRASPSQKTCMGISSKAKSAQLLLLCPRLC